MILIFLIKLNYLHFSISLGHTHGGGSWHILAQSWPKFHTPGSLWVPETLPRMAIVVPSLHHSLLCHFRHGAVPGMHILFLSGFFLMRSYSFVLSSVTIVKGKLASISTWVTLVDQFATAVDAWVGRICVLAPLPLLLFSLLSCQALMPVVPAIQHFLKVTNNLHVSKSNGQFSAIILPDSSATFDTVDRFSSWKCFLYFTARIPHSG